ADGIGLARVAPEGRRSPSARVGAESTGGAGPPVARGRVPRCHQGDGRPRGGPPMRAILPILTKEVLHIVRDARSLGAALILPLLMLLMFGYAIRIDVRNIDLAVVDQDKSPASRNLVAK